MNKLKKVFLIVAVFLLTILIGWIFLKNKPAKKIFFENVSSNTKKQTGSFKAVSFISPHHLVAQELIENVFQKASEINKNNKTKRIILLSPNHANIAHGWGIVSKNNWKTDIGEIKSDQEATEILLKEQDIFSLNNEAFENEHGIKNLLPFVKNYFPESMIIPIMIREGLTEDKIEQITEIFVKNFSENTVVILSADFSHYIGKTASEMHDQNSLRAIQYFDYAKIQNLDVDCHGGLAILTKYSEKLGFQKFNFLDNSNSSNIYGQNFGEENTSYLTGYFSQGEKQEKIKTADILFLGDFMLDRDMRTIVNRKGVNWLTEKIQRLFWGQDFNILNLESPITDNASVSLGSNETEKRHFIFTSDPEKTKRFFKANKINVVNLGNNHSANFEMDGIEQTKNNLNNSEIDCFGNPFDANNFLIKNINGLRLSFINYNEFSEINSEKISEKIKELKKISDLLIVYAHWGKEYQLKENEKQRQVAHRFIDSGADLIIGSHPHVVQSIEVYKNKTIFYSLGNFIFDQYFSEDVKSRLAVGASISKEKIDFYLFPLYAGKNGQIILMDNLKRELLLKRLAKNSTASLEDKKNIEKARFTSLNNQ